ncbi:MAG: Hydrogenase isoenzymes formation protein HypC [candidate division WS2 bacterium]|uniref:Hydrogenase isoenzymes formation protein HypC n=1 Tax=Psychracetigena formicireducens TaxID=2986056 RepID=A0A9E2F1L0_PSYF1|nr:Hydrogenase isoenzymes formation protein HypC [Candidatus Psychracetigena formicireducens]MBT9144822.1 Hydrogenase isoenzymes formation protein HypC [Candidatus Psychracetigena formicireducens]MBT9150231.1 Hydrogenase isoenzymes formation protein HypC [Candidatus Psychracetigena formicireducens]
MCVAVPAKIVSISGEEAIVDFGGLYRTISLLFTPEAQVEDYVIVHAGYAISLMTEEEAVETITLLDKLEQK